MPYKLKQFIDWTMSFLLSNYVVLFFMATLSYKLFYINKYILKLTWPDDQFTCGILMGTASIILLLAPMLLMKKTKNKNAYFLAWLISIILLIDVVYYSYFASLPSINLITAAGEAGGVLPAIVKLLHPAQLLLFADILVIFIIQKVLSLKIEIKQQQLPTLNKYTNYSALAIAIVFFGFALNNVGLNRINDIIEKAYDSTSTAQYLGVIGAHVVDISRFVIQETTTLSAEQISELQDWVKQNKPEVTANSFSGLAKGNNVIMIQVESLGGFVINQTYNSKEITPNLNKLATETQFFPNSRFVIGAGHTSDTDFVANTSFFPLDNAATFIRYGQDNFTGLPKIMTQIGYSADVYHGFNRNFWNRDIAVKSLGYQKFYAADNYSKGELINMGLNDGTFLAETADYIKNQPKPSLSYVITLTSHTPFLTNDSSRELGIDTSKYPDQVGGYLENINYVDRMLGEFFNELKTDKLYDDSLIVVYGDHTPVLENFTAGSITYDSKSNQGKEIPLFIKLPNSNTGQSYPNKSTTLDIMPTILDLVGVKTNFLMFGQSLFANADSSLKVCENQMVSFNTSGDCKDMLRIEKQKSAEIIRYNQFGNITK